MAQENVFQKIWNILYPLILYFLLDILIVWAVEALGASGSTDEARSNLSMIGSVIFLAFSIPVFYWIYRNDFNASSPAVFRKPWYFALLAVIGALASHGLSILITLLHVDNIIGNYTEIENNVFSASPVLVILSTAVLAPISEELLFRGILYKRLEKYLGGFWLPALISSLIFGIYHMNLAQGIFAFLFGLLICAVYEKVQNLWACIALHIGGNLVSVILAYQNLSYPSVGISIGVMVIALAGAFVLFYFGVRKKTFIA